MQPKYDKCPADPSKDYRMMSWDIFLTLREWAQEVANIEGYPVYLVGSSLYKLYPRDIDVCVIMPVADFEKAFGPIPNNEEELNAYLSHPNPVFTKKIPYWGTIEDRIRWTFRVDLKISPDSWFTNNDKMLLAEPNGNARIRTWQMLKSAERESTTA